MTAQDKRPRAAALSPEHTDALYRLSEAAGLAAEWEDASGDAHHVEPAILQALLERLSMPAHDAAACEASLVQLDAEAPAHRLPPLVTGVQDQPVCVPALSEGAGYTLTLEDGTVREGKVAAQRRLAPIEAIGYHELRCGAQRTRVAIAPPRCYAVEDAMQHVAAARQRPWGIGVQVYGLRRAGDGGIGDFTALSGFARRAAAEGADALAISPLHAMFAADPDKFSPYAPSSRLFLNTAHIDPSACLGQALVQEGIEALNLAAQRQALEQAELIDWPAATTARHALLRWLFAHRQRIPAAARAAFERFRDEADAALLQHARFEAIAAAHPGHWRDWPEALRDPESPAVAAYADAHRDEVDYHLFLQWLADAGLADAQRTALCSGMAIGLIADLAVGTDSGGSHGWSYREAMLQDLSVGAPPDLFNKAGQSWGLTTFAPRALRAQGFAPFLDMLRAAFRHAGGIRIDHILGLRRLWLVPEGQPASAGAYLSYPLDDLLRLVALESVRHRAVVVGEDLGTVPAGFRDELDAAGLLGMRVLWFERGEAAARDEAAQAPQHDAPAQDAGEAASSEQAPPAPFTPNRAWDVDALAMSSTHDLPTIAGWWHGDDIDWREKIGQAGAGAGADSERTGRRRDRQALLDALMAAGTLSPDAGIDAAGDTPPIEAALRFVAAAPCRLAVFPLEDVLGTREQPNLPGSTTEHPNWRRRTPEAAEACLARAAVRRRLALIREAR